MCCMAKRVLELYRRQYLFFFCTQTPITACDHFVILFLIFFSASNIFYIYVIVNSKNKYVCNVRSANYAHPQPPITVAFVQKHVCYSVMYANCEYILTCLSSQHKYGIYSIEFESVNAFYKWCMSRHQTLEHTLAPYNNTHSECDVAECLYTSCVCVFVTVYIYVYVSGRHVHATLFYTYLL